MSDMITKDEGRPSDLVAARPLPVTVLVPALLLVAASFGWWWSVRATDDDMVMSALTSFMLAWLAMMAAMMLPAILPVVRLYGLAAAKGRAAPLPFFVSGYLVVWVAAGLPAYVASRQLMMPLADGRPWAARLAGGVMLAAATWQLTPLKRACLRHCRSPLGFFMRLGKGVSRPLGAVRAGVLHGSICLGCCWALMAVLVALGTMSIAWMLALAGLIFLEKNSRRGEQIAQGGGVVLASLGLLLLLQPSVLPSLV